MEKLDPWSWAPSRRGSSPLTASLLLLQGLVDRQGREAIDASGRLVALQAAADDVKVRLLRLYRSIEDSIGEQDEVLKSVSQRCGPKPRRPTRP